MDGTSPNRPRMYSMGPRMARAKSDSELRQHRGSGRSKFGVQQSTTDHAPTPVSILCQTPLPVFTACGVYRRD